MCSMLASTHRKEADSCILIDLEFISIWPSAELFDVDVISVGPPSVVVLPTLLLGA